MIGNISSLETSQAIRQIANDVERIDDLMRSMTGQPPPVAIFSALITANVGNAHSWYKLCTLPGGPANDSQDGFGAQGDAVAGVLPAYAIDGSILAANTKVLMWYADTGTEMRCVAMAAQPATPTIGSQGIAQYFNAAPVSSASYTVNVLTLPAPGTYRLTWDLIADMVSTNPSDLLTAQIFGGPGGTIPVSTSRIIGATTIPVDNTFTSFHMRFALCSITHHAVIAAGGVLALNLNVVPLAGGIISNLLISNSGLASQVNWEKIG